MGNMSESATVQVNISFDATKLYLFIAIFERIAAERCSLQTIFKLLPQVCNNSALESLIDPLRLESQKLRADIKCYWVTKHILQVSVSSMFGGECLIRDMSQRCWWLQATWLHIVWNILHPVVYGLSGALASDLPSWLLSFIPLFQRKLPHNNRDINCPRLDNILYYMYLRRLNNRRVAKRLRNLWRYRCFTYRQWLKYCRPNCISSIVLLARLYIVTDWTFHSVSIFKCSL